MARARPGQETECKPSLNVDADRETADRPHAEREPSERDAADRQPPSAASPIEQPPRLTPPTATPATGSMPNARPPTARPPTAISPMAMMRARRLAPPSSRDPVRSRSRGAGTRAAGLSMRNAWRPPRSGLFLLSAAVACKHASLLSHHGRPSLDSPSSRCDPSVPGEISASPGFSIRCDAVWPRGTISRASPRRLNERQSSLARTRGEREDGSLGSQAAGRDRLRVRFAWRRPKRR